MLATQVSYWTYKENQRHNVATEREVRRHNIKAETQTDFYNAELQRHNLKTEAQSDWYNAETKRHNLASESIGRTQAQAALRQARAAESQASTAWFNAQTNRLSQQSTQKLNEQLAATSAAQSKMYESQASLNEENTRLRSQEVSQGWTSAYSNAITAVSTGFASAAKLRESSAYAYTLRYKS